MPTHPHIHLRKNTIYILAEKTSVKPKQIKQRTPLLYALDIPHHYFLIAFFLFSPYKSFAALANDSNSSAGIG